MGKEERENRCWIFILRECQLKKEGSEFLLDLTKYGIHGIQKNKKILVLGQKLMLVCGLVKFVHAVAYFFRLNFPATFSKPHTRIYILPSRYPLIIQCGAKGFLHILISCHPPTY